MQQLPQDPSLDAAPPTNASPRRAPRPPPAPPPPPKPACMHLQLWFLTHHLESSEAALGSGGGGRPVRCCRPPPVEARLSALLPVQMLDKETDLH